MSLASKGIELQVSRHAVKITLVSVGLSISWVLLGYVALGVHQRVHYGEAFEKTKVGESLAATLARFGPPSHLEPHYDVSGYDTGERSVCGQSCWIRVWYEIPFTLGTRSLSVDFDAAQHVINKYQWSSP
jgi:hypothetical protein